MSWLITLVIGAIVGVLGGWIMGRKTGTWHNIIVGIIGAIVGYWFFIDVLGLGIANTSTGFFSSMALIWEVIGSIVTLVVINAVQYGELAMGETEERRAYGPGVTHEYREKWHKRDDDRH